MSIGGEKGILHMEGRGRMVEPVFTLSDGEDSNTELRIAESSNCFGTKADVAKERRPNPSMGRISIAQGSKQIYCRKGWKKIQMTSSYKRVWQKEGDTSNYVSEKKKLRKG